SSSVGSRLRRPPRGLPLAGLAGRPRRIGRRGLPLDAVLRLRRLHRLWDRARRGFGHSAGRREPGHRPRPQYGRLRTRPLAGRRARPAPEATTGAGMRVRVRFGKEGKVRWTSHRDVARMWERAFRRVGLPLAYTAGFSPRPKVSFGLALPTGAESVAEYLDIELADGVQPDVAALPGRLSPALPVGIDVL